MSGLKIVVLPRDPNPYQELLYGRMRGRGARWRYGCTLTPSHSLNLLLLPLEFLCLRSRGYGVLHVHWTFGFRFAGAERSRLVRRLGRAWFAFVLAVAARAGLKVVWTAHNVLPHAPVFDDDVEGRRTLVRRCDLVLAHSEDTIDQLRALEATPRSHAVVPLGPLANDALLRLAPPAARAPRRLLFFGKVAVYKGLDDLIEAADGLGDRLQITIAGACHDDALAARLRSASERPGANVRLRLGYIADSDMPELFAAADALVFPFRTVTTSSSLVLGLAAARFAIIPDLPGLREFPEGAVLRYPAGRTGLRGTGLRGALLELAGMSDETIVGRGRAARSAVESRPGWDEIASVTAAAMRELTAPARRRGHQTSAADSAGTVAAGSAGQ